MISFDVTVDYDLKPVYEEISDRLETIIGILEEVVTQNCPVDTGRMRNSITSSTSGDEGTVSVGAPYASYTELRSHWFTEAVNDSINKLRSVWEQ